jgi:MerR family transcriptional regulator, light-induced transcriptional regulator
MDERIGGHTAGRIFAATGISPSTLRSWERRYGFPEPSRAAAGDRQDRRYTDADLEEIEMVVALREQGWPLGVAIKRARSRNAAPSLYAALASSLQVVPERAAKPEMTARSHAIEDVLLEGGPPDILVGAFQRETFYRREEPRWATLAAGSGCAVVFAEFPAARPDREDGPMEVAVGPGHILLGEWALACRRPGYAAALAGWEYPETAVPRDSERRFEYVATTQPDAVDDLLYTAALAAMELEPDVGRKLAEAIG